MDLKIPWWEKKLQLTTPKTTTFYSTIPRKTTPNYDETITVYFLQETTTFYEINELLKLHT